jgi:hypothetical protein
MNAVPVFFSAGIRHISAALALGVLLCSTPAIAATVTWGGGNANWGTAGSWVSGTLPVNGDSVLFTNVGTGSNSTVNISRTLNDITFDASANRTYTLVNSGAFVTTLGTITNNSSYVQNVNNNISFTTSGTINVGASGIRLGSRLTGSGNVLKTGSGLLEITNGNNSGYTGTFTVGSGSVKLTSGLDSAAVVVDTGATLLTANDLSNGFAAALTVNAGGTLSPGDNGFGAVNVTFDSTLSAGSTTAFGVGDSESDQLISGGLTTFGGAFQIAATMDPANVAFDGELGGSSWALFSSGSFAGDFSSVTMTGTFGNVTFYKDGPDRWNSQYLGNGRSFAFFTSGPNAGVLYAVPEPSSVVFAGIGAAMFGWRSWTRRRSKMRRQMAGSALT